LPVPDDGDEKPTASARMPGMRMDGEVIHRPGWTADECRLALRRVRRDAPLPHRLVPAGMGEPKRPAPPANRAGGARVDGLEDADRRSNDVLRVPVIPLEVDRLDRAVLTTDALLADDEDRRLERHRRIPEASVARRLDPLVKVRARAGPEASPASSERAPQLHLRLARA
jgi:hypothetical protein